MTTTTTAPRFSFTPLNKLPHPDLTRRPVDEADAVLRDLAPFVSALDDQEAKQLDRDLARLDRDALRMDLAEQDRLDALLADCDRLAAEVEVMEERRLDRVLDDLDAFARRILPPSALRSPRR